MDMGKIEANSRAEQALRTRQTLLDVALTLFSQQGYSKTSIRSIARAAGLSDGILYHHFPQGKQQILSVLLSEGIGHAFTVLNQCNLNLQHAPLFEVLNCLCELSVQLFAQYGDLLKIILRENEAMQLDEIHVVSQLFLARQQWLAQLLAVRQQQGEIRQMDFELIAQQFMALNLNYGLTQLLNLNIGCDLSDLTQRHAMLKQILALWSL